MSHKKILAGLLVWMILFSFGGCFEKTKTDKPTTPETIELVYYRMFDDEDVIKPLISEYQSKHPNVRIIYRKFSEINEYLDLVVNELAEGEGPDMMSVPNYWVLRNVKKINPLPETMMSVPQFEQTFVSVAKSDLVLRDPYGGGDKIYGIPLMVDTLALYYNKAAYEDKIPSRGRPASTWEELKEDVFLLTKKDNSFERFEVAGIALGRADNVARAVDVLYLLMLQYKASLYNENISKAEFSRQKSTQATGESINPATEALNLFSSFALPANKNYSWNAYLSDPASSDKELETFAKGKVVMIFGYSYLYEQILAKIKELRQKGVTTINESDIKIAVVPQIIDPAVSSEKRDAYANYFVETVSRTSDHPQEAWDFLMFLSSKENIKYYGDKTHRPTSRRDMIEEQKVDPVYGVYAEQTGYAESFPIYDQVKYSEIFSRAIDSVLATISPSDAIKVAESAINEILPPEGLIPPAPPKKAE